MSDFINKNNNFERSPGLTKSDIDWFRNVVFLANISNLSSFFEEDEVTILRAFILEYRYKDISINENVEFTTDFRRVYASILENWLRLDQVAVLDSKFETFNMFAS